MRIAIASSKDSLDSPVDPRFGRCPYFAIAETESEEINFIENTAGQAFRGAGITAAQMIADKEVGAVIAGNFGPKALRVLSASKIKIYAGIANLTVKEALDKFKKKELKEAKLEDTSFGPGGAGGWGRGGGRQRWQ